MRDRAVEQEARDGARPAERGQPDPHEHAHRRAAPVASHTAPKPAASVVAM